MKIDKINKIIFYEPKDIESIDINNKGIGRIYLRDNSVKPKHREVINFKVI